MHLDGPVLQPGPPTTIEENVCSSNEGCAADAVPKTLKSRTMSPPKSVVTKHPSALHCKAPALAWLGGRELQPQASQQAQQARPLGGAHRCLGHGVESVHAPASSSIGQ